MGYPYPYVCLCAFLGPYPIKLETGLRPYSAGIFYTLLLRIEAIGFPTFGLLPYTVRNPDTASQN